LEALIGQISVGCGVSIIGFLDVGRMVGRAPLFVVCVSAVVVGIVDFVCAWSALM
jgi:hypothetical protein